jgi:hypothetical protein
LCLIISTTPQFYFREQLSAEMLEKSQMLVLSLWDENKIASIFLETKFPVAKDLFHDICLFIFTVISANKMLFKCVMPIAVAERSKARTFFARSNTEIVGSNPSEAWMFVCVLCAFFLFLHSLK